MAPRSADEKLKLALDICCFLNDLRAVDHDAIRGLVEHRVECNDALLNHPTVQVAMGEGGAPMVGVLGILNGYVGASADDLGYIVAVFSDDESKLERFEVSWRK